MSGATSRRSARRPSARPARRRTAGSFGGPLLIAELLGLYGLVLVVIGIAGRPDQASAGVGADLWAGTAMLALALLLAGWSLRRSRAARPPADDDRAG